jgi:DNA polymerase
MATPARSAADYLPERRTLPALQRAAAACRGCELYRRATQTVFGEGPRHARLVLVGEQPGDKEDIAGRPFVGPAGLLLNRALEQAGIARDAVYVTNAVKHFKWTARGKRRLHQRPREGEIDACRPWLEAEVRVLKPAAVVCLGATAARAVYGRTVRIKDMRGHAAPSPLHAKTFVTVHPSAILRLIDGVERERAFVRFVTELTTVRRVISAEPSKNPQQNADFPWSAL